MVQSLRRELDLAVPSKKPKKRRQGTDLPPKLVPVKMRELMV